MLVTLNSEVLLRVIRLEMILQECNLALNYNRARVEVLLNIIIKIIGLRSLLFFSLLMVVVIFMLTLHKNDGLLLLLVVIS